MIVGFIFGFAVGEVATLMIMALFKGGNGKDDEI